MGRNGLLGVLRRLPDAQGIALHTAPTQEAISSHQMGHYQRPLVLVLGVLGDQGARGGELVVEDRGDRVLISGRVAPYLEGRITI